MDRRRKFMAKKNVLYVLLTQEGDVHQVEHVRERNKFWEMIKSTCCITRQQKGSWPGSNPHNLGKKGKKERKKETAKYYVYL